MFATDETDAFNYTATSKPLPPSPAQRRLDVYTLAGAGPTVHYRSVASLAYVTDDPKPDFNGRTMRCIAIQSGFAKVVASATLIVRRTY